MFSSDYSWLSVMVSLVHIQQCYLLLGTTLMPFILPPPGDRVRVQPSHHGGNEHQCPQGRPVSVRATEGPGAGFLWQGWYSPCVCVCGEIFGLEALYLSCHVSSELSRVLCVTAVEGLNRSSYCSSSEMWTILCSIMNELMGRSSDLKGDVMFRSRTEACDL